MSSEMGTDQLIRPLLMSRASKLGLLVAFVWMAGVEAAGARSGVEVVSEQLRLTLETAPLPLEMRLGDETVLATRALPAFYEQRTYRAAWINEQGAAPLAADLVDFVRQVGREGLRPEDYHLSRLEELLEIGTDMPPPSPNVLVEIDLLLTDAFLMLGAHLVSGRVDPIDFDREWIAVRREVDLVEALEGALAQRDVGGALEDLLPDQAGYFKLRDLAQRYHQLVEAGGWQQISEGEKLELGASSSRVTELIDRLSRTGDIEVGESRGAGSEFDERVAEAVRRFQSRHGLDADGVVGPKTMASLNVPASARLAQIYLNMERWRWLPQDLGERYVLVNLPAFELQVIAEERSLLEMRVAVGRPFRRTPVFSDTIRYLVFNPNWEIPASIAIGDKLPEIRKDVGYLSRQGIEVFRGWGSEQVRVDPTTVDWSSLGRGNFPYRLRQNPGPLNALGRVKFMFPNRFSIYLHDTPGREVFKRSERDVSSGCIRLEKPLELADLLLQENVDWRSGEIDEILRDYRERTVRLEQPWPVHLLHWSAWVDDDDVAQFRADLYDRDDKLAIALAD